MTDNLHTMMLSASSAGIITIGEMRNLILRELSQKEIDLVHNHLRRRYATRKVRPQLSFVYDILYDCNLQCRGCSVSPRFVQQSTVIPESQLIPRTPKVIRVLENIRDYISSSKISCFINFGGGEPFLRSDLGDIVRVAADFFGSQGVGVDTNGTLDGQVERILDLIPFVSYLGISLDGLEEFHNWWRGGKVTGGAFNKTFGVLKELAAIPSVVDKIEVSSVATRNNLAQVPKLMESLRAIGVKKFSVHRAIPVGRMELMAELIPSAEEYFRLLATVVSTADRLGMDVHLHHSIESIYASILLDLPTYDWNRIGNPDAASSLGITPSGDVVFDPWAMRGPWSLLTGGNLLEHDLGTILDKGWNSVISKTRAYVSPQARCYGCMLPCSGGNRIAASAQYLSQQRRRHNEVALGEILKAMAEIDPACPLYESQMPVLVHNKWD